jgi:hypothetical protein
MAERLFPQLAGSFDRVEAGGLPPECFVVVEGTVIGAAERDRELIADLACRARSSGQSAGGADRTACGRR